MLKVFVIQFKS